MMWSPTVVEGKPRLLVIDASRNAAGWEAEAAGRFASTMLRRGIDVMGGVPLRVASPEELEGYGRQFAEANCLVLLTQGQAGGAADLKAYWEWLAGHVSGPKLVTACSWGDYDASVNGLILGKQQTFAPLSVAPRAPVSQREGSLFLLKFFIELALHTEGQMTGKMVWFSWSKARALLKRRRLNDNFGVRA
ncbi:MAG: hypothetical protein FJ320_03305 [SAR202 cluster bacterium]|nr:hypothetical protein [SAR202 cluster bacterium]